MVSHKVLLQTENDFPWLPYSCISSASPDNFFVRKSFLLTQVLISFSLPGDASAKDIDTAMKLGAG